MSANGVSWSTGISFSKGNMEILRAFTPELVTRCVTPKKLSL